MHDDDMMLFLFLVSLASPFNNISDCICHWNGDELILKLSASLTRLCCVFCVLSWLLQSNLFYFFVWCMKVYFAAYSVVVDEVVYVSVHLGIYHSLVLYITAVHDTRLVYCCEKIPRTVVVGSLSVCLC